MQEGYYALRQFWGFKRFGPKHKMMVFKAIIEGALYSGLEALCLSAKEVHSLEVERIWVLRKMAGKVGVTVAPDGIKRQKSNEDILRTFRLVPTETVLFQRRVTWMQGMARQPGDYVQFRAAVFGSIRL